MFYTDPWSVKIAAGYLHDAGLGSTPLLFLVLVLVLVLESCHGVIWYRDDGCCVGSGCAVEVCGDCLVSCQAGSMPVLSYALSLVSSLFMTYDEAVYHSSRGCY